MRTLKLKDICSAALFTALAIAGYSQADKDLNPNNASPSTMTSSTAVGRAITMAGEYLERATSLNGRFAYCVDSTTGTEILSYNVVRHAGAM